MAEQVSDRGRSYRELYEALKQAQKPPHGTAAYSRFFNRPFGRMLAVFATKWGLSPDQVTALSGLHTLAALVLIAAAPPSALIGIAVAALLVLGYALDSADGQVARLTGQGSPRGEWFDHMVDATKVSSLHLCVAIHWFRFDHLPALMLLIPLAYSVVASVTFFGQILTDLLRRHLEIGPARNTGSLSVLRSIILLPADYGFLCVCFVLLGWPMLFAPIYTVMAVLALILLGLAILRWRRLLPSAR